MMLVFVGIHAYGENATPPLPNTPVPILIKGPSTDKGGKPRVPAAHPLPVCIYADGILSINFPSPEGEAEVVITHEDFTEEYTVSTEYSAVISTDLYQGDTVEITTESGNIYVAVYEE